MIITSQGDLNVGGGVIYGPPVNNQGYITGMSFTNLSSFVLEVYLYRKVPNSKKLLYKLTLDAGDIVEDDTEYVLDYGDYLWAKSSVTGTQFVIMGSVSRTV